MPPLTSCDEHRMASASLSSCDARLRGTMVQSATVTERAQLDSVRQGPALRRASGALSLRVRLRLPVSVTVDRGG